MIGVRIRLQLAAVLAVVSAFASACDNSPAKGVATPTGEIASATSTVAISESSPTPAPVATTPMRHSIPSGATLPSENGLLYIKLDTGEMEFWAMPGTYWARPISRDGRWVVWSAKNATGVHLLDVQSGRDQQLTLHGNPAGASGMSNDGRLVLLNTPSSVALIETETGRVIAETPHPGGTFMSAAEFGPDGSVAHGYGDNALPRGTIVLRLDGTVSKIDGGAWPMRWSADGTRLALTTATGTRIVTSTGQRILEIPFGGIERGFNLRWSPGGRYLAVANAYNVGGQRVFDAATGVEVLRTTGTPSCIGDYWLDDGTLEYGFEGLRVLVPSGKLQQGVPRWPRAEGFTFDNSVTTQGLTRLLLADGLKVEFRSESNWSVYYDGDGIRSTTSDGRALFLVGIGGKGLCDSGFAGMTVELPPFS